MATAIEFAEYAAAERDVLNYLGFAVDDLAGGIVDPDFCARAGKDIFSRGVRDEAGIGFESERIAKAPVAHFLAGRRDMISALCGFEQIFALFHFLLPFGEDGLLARVVGIDGDFQNLLPIVQLLAIGGGIERGIVVFEEEFEGATTRRDYAIKLVLGDVAVGAGIDGVLLDALEFFEGFVVGVLGGDYSLGQGVNLGFG